MSSRIRRWQKLEMGDFASFYKEPEKKIRSIIKKLTHSGETDLDKELLVELKKICKSTNNDDLLVFVYKECMKCLHKPHSQVRVATVKLLNYLFQKAHTIREKLLDDFDVFLELTLAISHKPKVKLVLPPPKKHATLLRELTAKLIHSWHAEYSCGYEKLRYAHRFLREHRLVDFSRFQVHTHEQLIKRQKLAERQEKILSRSIENRMAEFHQLKPEIEDLLAQIQSLIDLLIDPNVALLDTNVTDEHSNNLSFLPEAIHEPTHREHGITNLAQSVQIEFSPYVKINRNRDNKDVVQNLKELKKQLITSKLTKLIAIEKLLSKRSEQFLNPIKEIIDLKNKATNIVLKLGELEIVNELEDGNSTKNNSTTLDNIDSETDDEFQDVEPKEDLETYIPKSMRFEYGLEAIDPKELNSPNKIRLTEESFDTAYAEPSTSSSTPSSLAMACNVRLESGKLCPRRDKIKCPFHGKIIPRDQNGTPINEQDRIAEEKKLSRKGDVPDWQDPELLRDIKAATGVDLTMPAKGKRNSRNEKKLANTRTCDLTSQQRLKKRLNLLNK